MQLSEAAKELVAKHVAALTQANEATLGELKFYRWALRAFFVLLFGGSILGVLKLQDYLDDRIQKRSEELSGILYGSLAQSSEDHAAAVDQFAACLEKLENPVFRPAESVRAIYYRRFLFALADDMEVAAKAGRIEQARLYDNWLEMVLLDYADRVIDVDADCAQVWGGLLSHQKTDPPTINKQIAAMALISDMTIVTRDQGDGFRRVPNLKVLNPFGDQP